MKTAASLGLMLLLTAGAPALAQGPPYPGPDQINIYSDTTHTSKEALDLAPGTLTVFVVHEKAIAATSAAFRIAESDGFTGMWLSETSPFLLVGSSPLGVIVGYNRCLPLPALILEVTYAIFGTSEDCSYLEVVAHPDDDYGGPLVVDCVFDFIIGTGGRLTINPNESCAPVPVEHKTWGKVKALFR